MAASCAHSPKPRPPLENKALSIFTHLADFNRHFLTRCGPAIQNVNKETRNIDIINTVSLIIEENNIYIMYKNLSDLKKLNLEHL